jgi:hypothetical protein
VIITPTVFIIGAGASHEAGFPLGSELASGIATDVDFRFDAGSQVQGDKSLYSYLRNNLRDRVKSLELAGRRLSGIIPTFPSVDEALHYLSGDPEAIEIGKMAIAHRILQSEHALVPNSTAGSWLPIFLSLALSGHRRETVASAFSYVTIVCFNYDRVIEQYLTKHCKLKQVSLTQRLLKS